MLRLEELHQCGTCSIYWTHIGCVGPIGVRSNQCYRCKGTGRPFGFEVLDDLVVFVVIEQQKERMYGKNWREEEASDKL